MNTRKDKADFLKGLQQGKRSMVEILGLQVTMWKEDENDNTYLICFDGDNVGERISKSDYKASPGRKVTLDLNK